MVVEVGARGDPVVNRPAEANQPSVGSPGSGAVRSPLLRQRRVVCYEEEISDDDDDEDDAGEVRVGRNVLVWLTRNVVFVSQIL